jgi:hypothetical protein
LSTLTETPSSSISTSELEAAGARDRTRLRVFLGHLEHAVVSQFVVITEGSRCAKDSTFTAALGASMDVFFSHLSRLFMLRSFVEVLVGQQQAKEY